ncbi:transposase family protein [Macrococcoides caseolyticum]|uniref:transposase family protein n=1 Tax=Macrococcoides caseolyticum TaxID=69966 RepID=UPI0011C05F13|nr:transposase family protein [Macrococcus caseolyticus]
MFVNEDVCFFISYAILRHVDFLKTFEIKRSLNTKDCPYDNAVAEATMKLLKFHN